MGHLLHILRPVLTCVCMYNNNTAILKLHSNMIVNNAKLETIFTAQCYQFHIKYRL